MVAADSPRKPSLQGACGREMELREHQKGSAADNSDVGAAAREAQCLHQHTGLSTPAECLLLQLLQPEPELLKTQTPVQVLSPYRLLEACSSSCCSRSRASACTAAASQRRSRPCGHNSTGVQTVAAFLSYTLPQLPTALTAKWKLMALLAGMPCWSHLVRVGCTRVCIFGPSQLPLHRRFRGLAACNLAQPTQRCGVKKGKAGTAGIHVQQGAERFVQGCTCAVQHGRSPAAISSAACRCSSAAASCCPMASYSSSSSWGSCTWIINVQWLPV